MTNGHDAVSPRPVPEAGFGGGPPAVTDDERNRYGALLDAAAERGLLSPTEYQARLGEVAEAPSVAELQRIVTELPAFGIPTAAAAGRGAGVASSGGATASTAGGPSAPDLDAILWAGRTQAVARRDRGNQWIVLAVVVGVLLVALVALGLVAAHLTHTHGAGTPAAVVGRLSSLRL
jgi:hypothetical protein